jgi:hypothetical protein
MRLKIPNDQVTALHKALSSAGAKEIGGQIFGEQLAPSDFLASELTFQKRHGTFSRFIVDLIQTARDALQFFDRTKHRYTRFNYIGEWHSHPSFNVYPSVTDVETMRELVRDSDFKGNFAVLIITKLESETIKAGGWLFDPNGREFQIKLELCK